MSTRRKFIREGALIKLSPKGAEQERQFFLFNDILIYARRKRLNHERFAVKGIIPMDLVLIRDIGNDSIYPQALPHTLFVL